MKKWLDRGLTAFAVLFSVPTFLILISWNAIPGDRLYKVKAALEDIALAITIRTPIAQALSLEFTDRRFDEATKLLAKEGTSIGYELVVAEAQQTESLVLAKSDVNNGATLIKKIEQYQTEIDQQKESIQAKNAASQPSGSQPVYTLPPAATPVPAATPIPVGNVTTTTSKTTTKTVTINKPVQITIEEQQPEEIVAKLEQTKQELEVIKERVKKELPDSAKNSHNVKVDDASQKDRKDDTIDSGDKNKSKDDSQKESSEVDKHNSSDGR